MKKIEFIAKVEDGFLKVPQKYKKDLKSGAIRVVLFVDDEQDKFEEIAKKNIKKYSKALDILSKK